MTLTLKKSSTHPIVPLAVAAFLITLLLFFIDEGNYSFENIVPGQYRGFVLLLYRNDAGTEY